MRDSRVISVEAAKVDIVIALISIRLSLSNATGSGKDYGVRDR